VAVVLAVYVVVIYSSDIIRNIRSYVVVHIVIYVVVYVVHIVVYVVHIVVCVVLAGVV
jgi:hypothetical protein